MQKPTWDFNLRVSAELAPTLMSLITENIGIEVLHIGQTKPTLAPKAGNGRDVNEFTPFVAKAAVTTMNKLRELAKEGKNATAGVWYKDIGVAVEAVDGTKASSISAILSILHRAGKIKKISRGRYLPTVP